MTARTMFAMVVDEPGAPEVLQPRELPVPEPGPGQARIRVAWAGMTPVDAMVRRERLPWMPVTYPLVPGMEHTGVVDAVGEGVDAALVGRQVLSRQSFGGYAEYSLARAAGLIELPAGIGLKVGAAYRGCSATAWYALHGAARVRAGDRVLVHSAAGAVGAMALQIARDAGAKVCGLAGGPGKVEFASGFLADPQGTVLDYLRDDWVERARAFAAPGGFDVILDGNGGPAAAHNATLVGALGRIVYVGATAGTYPEATPVAQLITKCFAVGGLDLRAAEAKMERAADPHLHEAIVGGRWRVPVSESVPLAEVAALHRRLETRQVMGRAVIEVGGDRVGGGRLVGSGAGA
jgi:NADPH2:quinone reductase